MYIIKNIYICTYRVWRTSPTTAYALDQRAKYTPTQETRQRQQPKRNLNMLKRYALLSKQEVKRGNHDLTSLSHVKELGKETSTLHHSATLKGWKRKPRPDIIKPC